MNAALHIVRSNGWRDPFNPLRGFALSRIYPAARSKRHLDRVPAATGRGSLKSA